MFPLAFPAPSSVSSSFSSSSSSSRPLPTFCLPFARLAGPTRSRRGCGVQVSEFPPAPADARFEGARDLVDADDEFRDQSGARRALAATFSLCSCRSSLAVVLPGGPVDPSLRAAFSPAPRPGPSALC